MRFVSIQKNMFPFTVHFDAPLRINRQLLNDSLCRHGSLGIYTRNDCFLIDRGFEWDSTAVASMAISSVNTPYS